MVSRLVNDLGSSLEPVALSADRLPLYDEHHTAKHRLLEEYMKVWLAKLAQSYPQVAIIDGFASAGRYRDGRIGSPLIFLHAYLSHAARENFRAPPHFVFIEANRSFAQHLRSEIEATRELAGARVDVIHGEYEDVFPRAVDRLARRYSRSAMPTFAFVDPLGYEKTPFALLRDYRRQLGRTAEAMVYVPTDFMARFVGTDITAQALDKLFGSREAWETVRDQAHPGVEASRLLADAYADVLRGEYELVSSFAVDPASRNRYYLFFGTDHVDGLKAMKSAYWKVDPEDGRGYRQDLRTAVGQGELFAPAAEVPKEPEEDLGALIRAQFRNREFSIEEAELFALTATGFRETHVRPLALLPALDGGELVITHTPAKRRRAFPAGTRMRFTR
jgi:three-Cys-motif partner protein